MTSNRLTEAKVTSRFPIYSAQ